VRKANAHEMLGLDEAGIGAALANKTIVEVIDHGKAS
jgi:hypothetical protein